MDYAVRGLGRDCERIEESIQYGQRITIALGEYGSHERCRLHVSAHNPVESIMSEFFHIPRVRALVVTATLIASSGLALAADLKVNLTGTQETPPVTTSASGTGTISVAADKSISGTLKITGVNATMAHIHVGAAGQSGPPIITLRKGADGAWSVPAGSKLTDEQYADFKAGKLYVNVHSADHKSGEIRGQLKP